MTITYLKRVYLLFFLPQFYILTAVAQEEHPFFDSSGLYAGTYICVSEASGGVRYSKEIGKWHGVQFKSDDRLIMTLTFEGHEVVESFSGRHQVANYSAKAGEVGSAMDDCAVSNFDDIRRLKLSKTGAFKCEKTPFYFYSFNVSFGDG